MRVSSWEGFPDELRAALIKVYPSIHWRVVPFGAAHAPAANELGGMSVHARCGSGEIEIRVPKAAIESKSLHDLVDELYDVARNMLSGSDDQ